MPVTWPNAERVDNAQIRIERWNRQRLVPAVSTSCLFGASNSFELCTFRKALEEKSAGRSEFEPHFGTLARLVWRRRDLRRAQEIVISRRIQLQILHAPRMHEHVVEIPQIDVRQVLGQNALYLGV